MEFATIGDMSERAICTDRLHSTIHVGRPSSYML